MSEPSVTSIYENLPDNSHKGKAEVKQKQALEGKRAEKIISGTAKTKKNNTRNFFETFLAEDAANIWDHIKYDVIIPSFKKALYDIVVNGLDMSLFGGRGGKRSTADKVSYRDYSTSSRRDDRSYTRSRTTSGYSYDDIILETRGEAEAVLSRMDEIMEEYEIVRVADLYDLVGVTGEHTDNKYGWTNIRNAEIERVRDGYRIKMPRALPISR